MKYGIRDMKHPTIVHFRRFRRFRHLRNFSSLFTDLTSTTVENALQISPFYAKQTQFPLFFTWKRRLCQKTNPIQTQFKPNLSQNKANLSQFQSQFKPCPERSRMGQLPKGQKMNAPAWIRNFMIYCGFLANFTTLKGANFESKMLADLVEL